MPEQVAAAGRVPGGPPETAVTLEQAQSMISAPPSASIRARASFIALSCSGACGSQVRTSPTMRSGARER
jgi:hypothetical protein